MKKILALIDFKPSLYVSADALSKNYKIIIGGQKGILYLPSLPKWDKSEEDPLNKFLTGPLPAMTWKQGNDLIFWGRPFSYPSGKSEVVKAYVEFKINNINDAQKIYDNYFKWSNLFFQYVKVITTQVTSNSLSEKSESGYISLFTATGKLNYISRKSLEIIHGYITDKDVSLHYDQLIFAFNKTSELKNLKIEYRLLLNALDARSKKDYRMAIIDGANAIEICLNSRITEKCKSQNINFYKELLKKYKMLGGKIELAKMLGVLPEKNYNLILNEPRNNVMHEAFFPTEADANQMIDAVTNMLNELQPIIYEE